MMYTKRKVPAFTLMEVTIAMLIAALAIAVTYTAYHIISMTYLNYIKKQERIAAFVTVDKLLKKDFLMAEHIIKTAKGLDLQSGSGAVSYLFNDSCLIRSQQALQVDTFHAPVKSLHISFENAEVADEGNFVDQLKYETQLEGQSIGLTYNKLYSAQSLFR